MKKTVSVLGSTGSIGRQSLEVIREEGGRVAALAAHSNVDLLERQVLEFRPEIAAMYDAVAADELRRRLVGVPVKIVSGMEGLLAAATAEQADVVVTAVVGMIGLQPTLAAIKEKKRIALANKETLVCAGRLVMQAAKAAKAEIIPVDSEHSAIFQCLQGCHSHSELKKILLTCSGGPFYGKKCNELQQVNCRQALQHPNWKMGAKITIDSATLMNKGLELMEAMHLFSVAPDQIQILIHRQSIVHSMVEFRDGAVLAQLGTPNMKLPIRYALTYPHRAMSFDPALDLLRCGSLTFDAPDTKTFRCLALAQQCAKTEGTAGAILNGANEEAVRLFLQEKIHFLDIPALVEHALNCVSVNAEPQLEDILEADRLARQAVLRCAKG